MWTLQHEVLVSMNLKLLWTYYLKLDSSGLTLNMICREREKRGGEKNWNGYAWKV